MAFIFKVFYIYMYVYINHIILGNNNKNYVDSNGFIKIYED